MANVKYLSYDGLKHYDAKLKDFILKGFANGVSVTQNEENNIVNLSANYVINNVATSSIIATAAINLATTSKAGLMSKEDFSKLDSIEASAQVNQNAFSKIKVGSTTIEAGKKTDTLTIAAGDNITLTPSAKTLTIAAKDTVYVHNNYTANTVNATGTTPAFGGTFEAFSEISNNSEGHVTKVTKKTVTIPSLPNVSVTDKGNTEAANAGDTTVKVVKTVTNGTTASATNVYLDCTTVEVPTKKYVDATITSVVNAAFKANDAMIYKGVVNKDADLPYKACNQGWTYRVGTAGTYAGQVCEVGDMIICLTDGTTSVTGTWNVINTNVDGAVYNTTDISTKGNFAAFDSTTGKLIKDSGFNPTSFATASHGHTLSITGNGDDVINVTENNGDLSCELNVTHKKYTSATFAQSATSAKPGTSIKFNVPTFTVDGYGHVENVSSSAITVTLPAYPTKLPNPTSLTVKWNNESNTAQTTVYDGSAVKEVDLTKGIYYAVTASYASYAVTAGHSVTAGNAAVAAKLTTSTGSATKPVYFKDGKPVACTYSLNIDVPADAIFDDTLNTAGTVSTSSAQLYIVGAKLQLASAETYSSPNAYIGQDNKLYAIGSTATSVASVITCDDVITNAEIDALF